MPNFTKKAIKETFVALLEERPLNRITVKDIVERCCASGDVALLGSYDVLPLVGVRKLVGRT